jgi:hypothetical protein
MRRVETGDPRRLEYRSGGGPRILVGLLLMGIAAGLGILGFQEGDLPVILGAVLFLACGVFIGLGRSALEFDLDARTYRSWWSKSLEDLEIAKVGEPTLAGKPASGFPIVARSDEARVAFGQHLPEAEKTWILHVLKQVLTA